MKAFASMRSLCSNIHLILVGTGNLLTKMKEVAKGIENLHVLGYVSDEIRENLLSASDAYISLSCYEGLPLAALEAAAAGLPLVLSDIPAHRWLVEGLGMDGSLVSPLYSYLQSSNVISYLVRTRDSVRKMHSRATLSWPIVLGKYLELLE